MPPPSPNMSQHYYNDYETHASSSTGSGSYDSATSTSRLIASHPTRNPVSLQVEDDDDDDDYHHPHSGSSSSHPPGAAIPPPGYDDLYHRDDRYHHSGSRSLAGAGSGPWSGSGRHRHHSSSSTGPLLGGGGGGYTHSLPRRVGGRLATCLPYGRRWGPRRTTLCLLSFCSLAVLAWLSLTPSGAERLASFRQQSLGLGSEWKAGSGAAASIGESGGAAADKYKGWEFARDASLVYTWVNGSDPEQLALRVQYGTTKQTGGSRDRDNDDLRYSMRSMAAHLPWHRGTIYIVSPTLPTWLNTSHPRIRWVNQDAIVPAEFQPVFSSNAVEPYLHLIPGLTERFLVFNDDFMIRRQMEPWDFFTSSGAIKLFLETGHVDVKRPVPENRKGKQAWLYSVHHTVELLYARYGKGAHWPDPHHTPRFVKHAPFVYYRAAFDALHAHFGPELAANARHRFRNPDDVLVPFLHHGYVTQEGSRCCGLRYEIVSNAVAAHSFFFVSWTDNRTANALALDKMARTNPQVAAFNDNMGRGPEAHEAQRQMHEHFVDTYKNYPPVFEL
ncbi:hypothetical protein OC834_006160 [Tilletia horrida]|nr:hypothetical protein OC834_006160 [Tilletia horrida]